MNFFSHTPHALAALTAAPLVKEDEPIATLASELLPAAAGQGLPKGCNIQLTPDGFFSATDGRPGRIDGCKASSWQMSASIAASLIADITSRKTPLVVDYEHQTLASRENGLPAPASGWMTEVTYVPGRGLFAHVEWTAKARQHIAAGEYRYISPVFTFDRTSGAVTRLLHAALTNFPALDGLAAVAASRLSAPPIHPPLQEKKMNEALRKRLVALLKLPDEADEATILAALTKESAEHEALQAKLTAEHAEAAKKEAVKKEAQQKDMAAQADIPISMTALTGLQGEIASLRAELAATKEKATLDDISGQIDAALKDGRLPKALETWALELGKKDRAALTTFLEAAQPIAALSGMQTDKMQTQSQHNAAGGAGQKAQGGSATGQAGQARQARQASQAALAALSSEEKYAAEQLGITPEDFLQMKEHA